MSDVSYGKTLSQYQAEITPWGLHNFGTTVECPPEIAALGLGEEVGEVQRCLLKRYQNIRGTYEQWTEELKHEIGDVFIKLAEICYRTDLDFEECVEQRWAEIRLRDFKANRIGHGMPVDD